MIEVTRLDGRAFTLNADLIELIESHPDTYIRMINGDSFIVREERAAVVERVIAYRRQIFPRTYTAGTVEAVTASSTTTGGGER